MDFVSRANRVHVDPGWMIQAVQLTGFAHDHPEAVHEQMAAIVKVLQDVQLDHDQRSMAAASISFRLEALTSLVLAVRKHRWKVPASYRSGITREALVRCACEEPLIVHKGRPAFDPPSFAKRLGSLLRSASPDTGTSGGAIR